MSQNNGNTITNNGPNRTTNSDIHVEENQITDTDEQNPEHVDGSKNPAIKFKRKKKKLIKGLGSQYFSVFKDLTVASRFKEWTNTELATLLVGTGIELRNENLLSHGELVDLVDALYEGQAMPARPRAFGLFELANRHVQARRIQFWYRCCKAMQKFQLEQLGQEEEGNGIEDFEVADTAAVIVEGIEPATAASDTAATTRVSSSSSRGGKSAKTAVTDQPKGKKRQNVLDIKWQPPSVTQAEKNANLNMPRRDVKRGRFYDFLRTTSGRHCLYPSKGDDESCGILLAEQFDAWEEGQVSEFQPYGSGVVNYFKFIKWCIWVFIILFFASAPTLILNIYGPNEIDSSNLYALSRTTFGNLVPYNVTTQLVNEQGEALIHVPGCYGFEVIGFECMYTRFTLGRTLAALDCFVTFVILFAIMWLRKFERIEDVRLNKRTYTASMYTIAVSNLPDKIETYKRIARESGLHDAESDANNPDSDCREYVEDVLRAHFKSLLHQAHSTVAYICVAYNNEDEIRESINRGNLIRQKIQLANEFRASKRKDDTPEQTKKKLDDLKAATHQINLLLEEKLKLLDAYAARPAQVLQAYITFNTVSDRNKALALYGGLSFLEKMCPSPSLTIGGKMPIVTAAAEPGVILWENLHFSVVSRIYRRFISTFGALLWICMSLFVIFGAKFKVEESLISPDDEMLSIIAQVCTACAAFIVLLVNIAIECTIRYHANYEKHHTEDNKNKSIFFRIFVIQYINTSIIFLLNNSASVLHAMNITILGGSLEFTANWYNTIGVTVLMVAICNCFTSHIYKFIQYRNFVKAKKHYSNHPELLLTQDDLNKHFVGPEMDFSYSYAQMLTVIFLCLTFSTGMPVLYLICAGYFVVFYFVEKYMFINMYRNPNHFTATTGKRVTSLLPYALLIHLWMAIWMLTNPEMFEMRYLDTDAGEDATDNGFAALLRNKITGKAVLPLFILFLLFVFGRIVYIVIRHFYQQIDWFVKRYLKCCNMDNCFGLLKPKAAPKAKMEYWEAIQADSIKGLKNYNILQNKKYKEAFAITNEFAESHKNVSDVRFQTKNKKDSKDGKGGKDISDNTSIYSGRGGGGNSRNGKRGTSRSAAGGGGVSDGESKTNGGSNGTSSRKQGGSSKKGGGGNGSRSVNLTQLETIQTRYARNTSNNYNSHYNNGNSNSQYIDPTNYQDPNYIDTNYYNQSSSVIAYDNNVYGGYYDDNASYNNTSMYGGSIAAAGGGGVAQRARLSLHPQSGQFVQPRQYATHQVNYYSSHGGYNESYYAAENDSFYHS